MHTSNKIKDRNQSALIVQQWKDQNLEIVFTNGCFDILHLGHIDYLEKASKEGQKLIIGINDDASITRLKGPTRPINNEYARARIIAALAFVDLVIVFSESTPFELIEIVKPTLLIKGNDYNAAITDANNKKYIVGSDIVIANGGKVKTIDLTQGYSTTGIVEKMKGNTTLL
jgi:D-glycero-beta-D-manno-heptose 1-phosphate adenylyltransferase